MLVRGTDREGFGIDRFSLQIVRIPEKKAIFKLCRLCISQFQARSSPPPRATPGHLTPVRLHIVEHLTRIETRPIGHLTRRKNAGQRSHKLSECFIHSQNLRVYFASNSF